MLSFLWSHTIKCQQCIRRLISSKAHAFHNLTSTLQFLSAAGFREILLFDISFTSELCFFLLARYRDFYILSRTADRMSGTFISQCHAFTFMHLAATYFAFKICILSVHAFSGKKTLNDLDVIALCFVYALFEVQECSAVIVN